jgi:hypothetical protein
MGLLQEGSAHSIYLSQSSGAGLDSTTWLRQPEYFSSLQAYYVCEAVDNLGFQPRVIIYAGQSERRLLFLNYCFPQIPVISLSGGPEEKTPDNMRVMHQKLTTVASKIDDPCFSQEDIHHTIIVASDTQTSPQFSDDDGNWGLVSLGKPEQLQSVYLSSRRTKLPPNYHVSSASGIHLPGSSIRLQSKSSHVITLDNESIMELESQEGFNRYIKFFRQFYSQPPYSSYDLKSISPTHISGGFSLPVLTQMRLVSHIDQVSIQDTEFYSVLRQAIYDAAVGISPKVLSPFLPNVEQLINDWPWLNQVTHKSIQGVS